MKLENFGDLFKYNKELLDDDYNAGQALVVKTKSKGDDNVTVSLLPGSRGNLSPLGGEHHFQAGRS